MARKKCNLVIAMTGATLPETIVLVVVSPVMGAFQWPTIDNKVTRKLSASVEPSQEGGGLRQRIQL